MVVVDDEPVGCLLPSCFEETMTDDQVDVEVSRAPDESKNKLVVKVHRARRLFGGGYGFEAVGATHPYVRAVYGDQTRETACRRRTTSPCWQEELTFEARGATTVKLLFYSRNTYMADSLLGAASSTSARARVCPSSARRGRSSGSRFSIAPEKRPTGPGDFCTDTGTPSAASACRPARVPGTLGHASHALFGHRSTGPRRPPFRKSAPQKSLPARGDARPFHRPLQIIS